MPKINQHSDKFGRESEKNWQVEQQSVVSENPWFRLLQSRVRMPDGRTTTYHTIDFLKVGVGIIARRDDQILLIRQYRFIIDQFVWAIPSGGVERGEDFVTAARRELLEESGCRAGSIERLLSYYPSYGVGNQEFHIYLAEDFSQDPRSFDENEVLDVAWFSTSEVLEMIFKEQIVDGFSLTPLLFLLAREAGLDPKKGRER